MSSKPKKRKRTTRHTTMRLPPELTTWLSEIAATQERSRTYIITKILEDYRGRTNQQLQSVFE